MPCPVLLVTVLAADLYHCHSCDNYFVPCWVRLCKCVKCGLVPETLVVFRPAVSGLHAGRLRRSRCDARRSGSTNARNWWPKSFVTQEGMAVERLAVRKRRELAREVGVKGIGR